MNGNNSNNRSNMVSPEELSLGGTGFSSPSSSGGMQENPFSQAQQGFSSVNSSSPQQQNPFQNVNQVASTSMNVTQQVVNTPMNVSSQVVNTPMNVSSQVVNQQINNYSVTENQFLNNGQQNFYNQSQPINQVSQPMINNNVSQVTNGSGNNGSGIKDKNITKSLFIAMTIIFLIFGIATVYVINIPSELECSTTSSENGVTYTVTYNYAFKNETLKDERVTMSIDLGDYYELDKDYYIEEGKKALNGFIDKGFKVDVALQKPVVKIKLHGDGETLMKVHDVNVFSDLSYNIMKATAENNNYVCK